MTDRVVYIVTRDRLPNLRKILPRWKEKGFEVYLTVERKELALHQKFIRAEAFSDYVSAISPAELNRGVGRARAFCVEHADLLGLSSAVMSDDDIMPSMKNSSPELLLEEVEKRNRLGIGAVRSYHDFLSGGAVSANSGVMLCPSGWGMQLFALNIERTIELGNFDARLECFGEDHELMRQGISNGTPWLVHCDVYSDSIGKRYEPGGLSSFAGDDRSAREIACRRIIKDMWPQYVSDPEKKSRMSWSRMLDDYIPGWKSESAIHGGKLKKF